MNRATDLPHNIKLFALTYIQRHGAEKWKKKTSEVKQRYFFGKMKIGKGPVMD